MALMLQDKVAIITGGGSGIGQAAAVIMAREGAKVVVADISPAGGEKTVALVKEQGGEAFFCQTDVTVESQVKNLIDTTVARYGRLDCACNNAGFGNRLAKLAELEVQDWTPVLNLCLLSTFMCMKYEIAAMLRTGGGAIVNTSSNAALLAVPTQSAYCSAKAGVIGLTRTAAIEYAAQGIRANTICPGLVDTPLGRHTSAGRPSRSASGAPFGRMATGWEIAYAVLFFMSDDSVYVNAQTLAVDSGITGL